MHNTAKQSLTIRVIGDGLAGTVAAVALAQHGHHVIVDNRTEQSAQAHANHHSDARSDAPDTTNTDASYERPLALSASSLRILSAITHSPLDTFCQQISATNIASIHVSEQGHVNRLLLDAPEFSLDRFGAVVSATRLLGTFQQALLDQPMISTLEKTDPAAIDLTILANGATSRERDRLGFETVTQPYRESALTGLITVSAPQPYTAFERFSADGPLALLPFGDHHYAYVITVDHHDNAQPHTPEHIQQIIEQRFGHRLGNITGIQPHASFPLTLRYAKTLVSQDTVLLGNTALSIHPIAGQGYNLVVRDIAWLVEQLTSHAPLARRLASYADVRQRDHQLTRHFTHSLVTLFDQPWLWAPRGIGLGLANWSQGIQKLFTGLGSGQFTRQPKLSFGIHPSALSPEVAMTANTASISGTQSGPL